MSRYALASNLALENRKDHFMDELCRRVLSMDLPPGASLDELTLANTYGISRSPIREVLRKLAAEGYIVLEANRAPRVSWLSQDDVGRFFTAAPLIYDATLQLAARNATASAICTLREIQSRYRRGIASDADELLFLVNALYNHFSSMANNSFLLPSFRRLLIDHARLEKIFHMNVPCRQSQQFRRITCLFHDQIVDSLQAGSPIRASQLIQHAMKIARRSISKIMRKNVLSKSQHLAINALNN